MEFKEGVGIRILEPQIVLALVLIEPIYIKFGAALIVTSCNDSLHMDHSLHYSGKAIDTRTRGIGLAPQLVEAIKTKLTPLGYQVLFEGTGTPNEHCHIEFDPR